MSSGLPKSHKTILTVVLLLTLGLAFKLLPTLEMSNTSRARSMEERYPSLYCNFHQCSPCSPDRIVITKDETIFQIQPTCITWVKTPPRSFHTDDLEDVGHVFHYVDAAGFHTVPLLPHQELDLTGRGCSTRGCEFGVSGVGKFRVQLQ